MSNVIPLRGKPAARPDCQNEGFSSPEGEPYLSEAKAESRRLELVEDCKRRMAADANLMMLAGSKELLMEYLSNLFDHFLQGYRK